MGECNKKAAGKSGDARKAFMQTCLSAEAPMAQQDKMKKCNAEADRQDRRRAQGLHAGLPVGLIPPGRAADRPAAGPRICGVAQSAP